MPLRRNTKQIFITVDNQPLVCEMCGADITSDVAYSIFLEYPMPGTGHEGNRCTVTQHFFCSHDHAIYGACTCLLYHIAEDVGHGSGPPSHTLPNEPQIQAAIDHLRKVLADYAG